MAGSLAGAGADDRGVPETSARALIDVGDIYEGTGGATEISTVLVLGFGFCAEARGRDRGRGRARCALVPN